MDMFGEEGRERAWSRIYELYIEPEVEKRPDVEWSAIYKVLIKLPKGKEPEVEFNDEVQFIYAVEDPVGRNAGEALEYYDFREIKEIIPPKVDNRSVAFIYAWRTRDHIYFACDFSPNLPDFDESSHKLSQGLEFHLKCKLIERMIPNMVQAQPLLLKHGLALFSRLLNYPLNQMVKSFVDGNPEVALNLLEEYANPDFIRSVVAQWNRVESFVAREPLFAEAVEAHANGQYHLSINALIGHIEGTITDWLYKEVKAPHDVPVGYKSRIETFKQTIEVTVTPEFAVNKVIESICEFLISPETLLQGYFDWNSPLPNINSPHRNFLAHGKYIRELYTKVNSIKMFLVLDSICFCIECYEDHKNEIQELQIP